MPEDSMDHHRFPSWLEWIGRRLLPFPDWLLFGLFAACVFAVGMLYGLYLCQKWSRYGP